MSTFAVCYPVEMFFTNVIMVTLGMLVNYIISKPIQVAINYRHNQYQSISWGCKPEDVCLVNQSNLCRIIQGFIVKGNINMMIKTKKEAIFVVFEFKAVHYKRLQISQFGNNIPEAIFIIIRSRQGQIFQ